VKSAEIAVLPVASLDRIHRYCDNSLRPNRVASEDFSEMEAKPDIDLPLPSRGSEATHLRGTTTVSITDPDILPHLHDPTFRYAVPTGNSSAVTFANRMGGSEDSPPTPAKPYVI
jgi:hypothetical protein